MELEKIKLELAQRVQLLMATRKRPAALVTSNTASKSWKQKVADTEDLVKKVYDTLYEVLQCSGIALSNDQELDGLISALEPSVNDLIIKNIED